LLDGSFIGHRDLDLDHRFAPINQNRWQRIMTDPLFPLLLLLRYMHILGAIALMGGAIFMRFALRPVVVQMQPEPKAVVHEQVRRRWARFVMGATLLILVSGLTNLALAARYDYEPVLGMPKGYHMVVGIKFLLSLPIFFIAAILAGRSEMAKRFQANAEMWMNVNLTLALVMVLVGGYLRFVPRVRKAPAASASVVAVHVGQIASQKLPFPAAGE
jgi:uncharacterized membrane protein